MQKIRLNPHKLKSQLKARRRDSFHIETGDNLSILRKLNPNQFDAMVTDPPAGIAFMGQDWDKDKGSRDNWIAWLAETMAECMRVLKPGAYALVWSIPRTQHWTMTALENAGFEICDVVYHLYGQGFPKSHDISKAIDKLAGAEREVVSTRKVKSGGKTFHGSDYKLHEELPVTAPATPEAQKWAGWGSGLKPACEPWILVQKPLAEKSIAENVLKHGVGGLNIDGSRIETTDNLNGGTYSKNAKDLGRESQVPGNGIGREYVQPEGRFPANVVFDEAAAAMLDAQSGVSKSPSENSTITKKGGGAWSQNHGMQKPGAPSEAIGYGDSSGGASRFFYIAKASKAEKNAGLDDIAPTAKPGSSGGWADGHSETIVRNIHPTIKPISLMKYLITLITPPGGTVFDPFMGSGTTGVAAIKNGFKFFGIDQDARYTDIARKRLFAVYKVDPKTIKTVKSKEHGKVTEV